MERKMAVEEYKNINNLEEKSINTIKKYIHGLNELCSFFRKTCEKRCAIKMERTTINSFYSF